MTDEITFPLSPEEYKQRAEELKQLKKNIELAFQAAEEFANKYHLSFYVQPAYGMGGTYEGDPDEGDIGWRSSSESC